MDRISNEEEIKLITKITEDDEIYYFYTDSNFYVMQDNKKVKVIDEGLIKRLKQNFKPGFTDIVEKKNTNNPSNSNLELKIEVELPNI